MRRFCSVFGLTAFVALGASSSVAARVEDAPAQLSQTNDARRIAAAAHRLAGGPQGYDAVIGAIADARFVLLGEATHGTHEFYRERARISERLMRERGFGAVIIEGSWPDTERINRYVRGLGQDASPEAALADIKEFPRWMWRNAEFAEFITRLRAYNETVPRPQRVGVYGMDVYNLFGAADAVVAYLGQVDPQAATRARERYRCFARYRRDPQRYGAATRRPARSCAEPASAMLAELRERPRPADPVAAEAQFSALRSAASVARAEEYFRAAYAGSLSWNVRDRRMSSTVAEVVDHVGALSGRAGKVLVWAHNSHVGDARATDAPLRGEVNLGQLIRERFGKAAYLVGFTTFTGTVIAAEQWGQPGRVHHLRPARQDSYAGLFHATGVGDALWLLGDDSIAGGLLNKPRFQRAVGVVYAPSTERESHYLRARLAGQFDAVIHLDRTTAVTSLR